MHIFAYIYLYVYTSISACMHPYRVHRRCLTAFSSLLQIFRPRRNRYSCICSSVWELCGTHHSVQRDIMERNAQKITHTQSAHTNHSRLFSQRQCVSTEMRNIGELNTYHSISCNGWHTFCILAFIAFTGIFIFIFSLLDQVVLMVFRLHWRPLVFDV